MIAMKRFLQQFALTTTAGIMIAQVIIIGLGILLTTLVAGDTDNTEAAIVTAALIIGLLEISLAPFIVKWLSRPLTVVTQAIMHVSKEASDTPPPNVNNPQAERSGLKALVQTIYELAANVSTEDEGQKLDFASSLLEKLPVAVLVFDRKEQLIFANQQSQELFSEFVEGKETRNLKDVQLLFSGQDTLPNWLIAARQDKIRDVRMWQRIANKQPGDEGRKIFDVIAYYNKHESHQIETTLVVVDRTQEYLAGDDAMDFIALAAHELRGPITVIRGYLDAFDEEFPDMTQDQRMLMERLIVSAGQLSGYINNILNVARYDRNHMQLNLQEENWSQLVASYLPELARRAHARGRKLTINFPDDLPAVAADAVSMQEVFTNLVDNAIKYSRDGGEIVIQAMHDGDFVETTVQDFGIGIPQSVMSRLFSKFYRSHRSRQAVSGTGLGLYLCKAIMESHGGSIWVRSEENQGSTFGFRLPTYASVAATIQKDDNSNERMIIKGSHGWIKNHSYYRR